MKPISEVITLDWILARCREAEGGCLVWTLQGAHGTDPQAKIGGREGKTVLIRRALWELVHERPFIISRVAVCSCKTPMCVHPDHIAAVPRNASQRGRPLSLMHRARLSASRAARFGKLSDADVAQIRASGEKAAVVAEQFGIDPTYVRYLRQYRNRHYGANPFLALGAR